eukprot:ANDGO_04062.mRNA.2 hypothetical protein CAOG_03956
MEHSVHASHWTHGERRSRENLVFTVLLVGEVGSGKSSLASAFRSFSSTTNIQFEIVTSESYPLPKDTRLDRIDLIVFLANLTAPSTLSSVSAWIKATDPLFLIGRCIVFATHCMFSVDAYWFDSAAFACSTGIANEFCCFRFFPCLLRFCSCYSGSCD